MSEALQTSFKAVFRAMCQTKREEYPKNTRLHREPNESNPNTHTEYFRLKSEAAQFTAVKKEHV